MFHDYITLLLANMTGGLFVLGLYLLFGAGREDRRPWSAAFVIPGLVGFIVGLHMVMAWPIPKLPKIDLQWANIAYGEMSVLLGALFLGASLSLARGWSLAPVGGYALVASSAAVVVGVGILINGLSNAPAMTAVGFFLTAGAGVLTALALTNLGGVFSRLVAGLALLAAAALWGFVAASAYLAHLSKFAVAAGS